MATARKPSTSSARKSGQARASVSNGTVAQKVVKKNPLSKAAGISAASAAATPESQLLSLAVHNLQSGIFITDPNQPDNPIIFANPGFTAITGYAVDEVIGRDPQFLQGPDTDPAAVKEMREAVANARPFRGLILNYRKDGTPFWNGLVINPVFDESGSVTHFIGMQNDVTASREQLRALAARLTTVREEERTAMSREIHCQRGQSLTGLKMDLSWMDRRLSKMEAAEDTEQLRDKMQTMSRLIDDTIQTVRKISTELRPSVLDDLGLEAAIEWQAADFQNRMGIRCQFASRLKDSDIDPEQSTAVFRILQETLTNVARHARATRVEIRLKSQAGYLIMTVKDNGRGITERELANVKSLGLLGMRERALLVGGEVDVKGAVGKGTTVEVRIPRKSIRGEDGAAGTGY